MNEPFIVTMLKDYKMPPLDIELKAGDKFTAWRPQALRLFKLGAAQMRDTRDTHIPNGDCGPGGLFSRPPGQ